MNRQNEIASTDHLYTVGQLVSLAPHVGLNLKISAVYEVLATLPARGVDLQYRVRSALEPYDRMVSEYDIVDVKPVS